MIQPVTLHVSFPNFGANYFKQHVIPLKSSHGLVNDLHFEPLMMEAATLHFSNEVVGLNDQFRFLSDVLASHLLEDDADSPARHPRQNSHTLRF